MQLPVKNSATFHMKIKRVVKKKLKRVFYTF